LGFCFVCSWGKVLTTRYPDRVIVFPKCAVKLVQKQCKALSRWIAACRGDTLSGMKQTLPILLAVVLLPHTALAQTDNWADRALNRIAKPPLGLPPVVQPRDNPATKDKIILGRKLFFDRRLSRQNTISCAMCHIPKQGFGNDKIPVTVGFSGQFLRRNAPTIFNVAYQRTLFHDGRDNALETQVYGPFLSPDEMANPSVGWLLQTVSGLEDYWGMFEKAFGQPVNAKNLGQALAAYQRTILSANSAFDKWQYGGQKKALSVRAIEGLQLFKGKAGCVRCHVIKKDSALFTDHKFHLTGIGVRSKKDFGRMEVTDRASDRYRFKTPGLRNIALTGPYMHDGSLPTLAKVVAFYNKGPAPNLPRLRLSIRERNALVAFLQSLTGDNVAELIDETTAQ